MFQVTVNAYVWKGNKKFPRERVLFILASLKSTLTYGWTHSLRSIVSRVVSTLTTSATEVVPYSRTQVSSYIFAKVPVLRCMERDRLYTFQGAY
jgi:hypothetical protein